MSSGSLEGLTREGFSSLMHVYRDAGGCPAGCPTSCD